MESEGNNDMGQNWYEYLKEKTNFDKQICENVNYAFVHGQVMFAWVAGLITEEQKDELNNRIPEY